jgi:hypothetical protein
MIYIGIDPGLTKTGVCIVEKREDEPLQVLHLEIISTKSTDELKVRFNKVRSRIRDLTSEFNVGKMVCEAYEVRTWGDKRIASVKMCVLINEISEEMFLLGIPMMLSSPRAKRGMKPENTRPDIAALINDRPKTHREHLYDAYFHLHRHLEQRGYS